MTSGPERYRWRTRLRRRLPRFLVKLGVACKGSDDCGNHEYKSTEEEDLFRDVNGDGLRNVQHRWQDGVAATDYYTWERQTYTLGAGRFRLLESTGGRYKRDAGQLELSNDLVCERPFPG